MRRIVVFALAIALGMTFAVPAAARPAAKPADPVSVDLLVKTCYHDIGSTINTPLYAVCRGLQALTASVAAACRTPDRDLPGAAAASCRLVDGRRISEARIAAYRKRWVHHALVLQRRLDARAPLYEETFAGTHNSFNASSYFVPTDGKPVDYYPTLTNQDPNQVYSITDQLRMDIRGIEIDLHWVPSIYGSTKTGGRWVDVCHGQSTAVPGAGQNVHVGCSVDRSLQNTLTEIRGWLAHHKGQFLLVYLENQLDGNVQAHNVTAALLHRGLGKLVYRPHGSRPSGHCASMPYAKSPRQMAASGARVLLVGNCGPGNWNRWVFTRGEKWNEGGNPTTYGATDCAADMAARESHSAFRRWYEESPFLEAAMSDSQTLTATATRRMVRCGVNLTGWDQLRPGDGRLRSFIWSWAPGQPDAAGRCAYQGRHGRFHASPCGVHRRAACVDRHLDWHVTKATGPAVRGQALCAAEFPRSRFGVPPNGYRDRQLTVAKPSGHHRVWLNYAKAHGSWHPEPARRFLR
jgi:hypothetical protein